MSCPGHVIVFRQYDYRSNPDLCGIYVESDFLCIFDIHKKSFLFLLYGKLRSCAIKTLCVGCALAPVQAKDSLPGRRQPVRSENKTREVF